MNARLWLVVNAGYFGLLGTALVVAFVAVLRLFYVLQVGEIAPYEARLAGSLGVALFAVILAIKGSRDPTVLRTTLAALLFVDLVNLAQTVAGALSGVEVEQRFGNSFSVETLARQTEQVFGRQMVHYWLVRQ